MARIRDHLGKAPIVEAIMDFRTRPSSETQLRALEATLSEIAPGYPEVEAAWLFQGSLLISAEPASASTASSSSRTPNGFHARSMDRKQVVQFRMDGFTFSRLEPYTSWGEIAPEAFRLWEIYRRAAQPSALFRVALRYVNRLRIPDEGLDFDDVLVSSPKVPAELPQLLEGYLTQVVIPLPTPNTHVRIVHGYNLPPAPNNILLDIDVYRTEELELKVEYLQRVFEELRLYKNQAFFGSLTEETVRSLE